MSALDEIQNATCPCTVFLSVHLMNAILITRTAIDFDALLGIVHGVTGRSIATRVDGSIRDFGDGERYLSHLDELAGCYDAYRAQHISYGVLVVGEWNNVCELITAVRGAVVLHPHAGALVAVVTATLDAWQRAKAKGPPGELLDDIRRQIAADGSPLCNDSSGRELRTRSVGN